MTTTHSILKIALVTYKSLHSNSLVSLTNSLDNITSDSSNADHFNICIVVDWRDALYRLFYRLTPLHNYGY